METRKTTIMAIVKKNRKLAAIANNFAICTKPKIVNIDIRLLWRSVACTKAFKLTGITRGIAIISFKVLIPKRSFVLHKSTVEALL